MHNVIHHLTELLSEWFCFNSELNYVSSVPTVNNRYSKYIPVLNIILCADITPSPPPSCPPPPEGGDGGQHWMLLVILCSLCALLSASISFICVYCLCNMTGKTQDVLNPSDSSQ